MRADPEALEPAAFEVALPRSDGFVIKLRLREADQWSAEPYADLRAWSVWRPKAGEPATGAGRPTKRGFTVPLEQLPALHAAIGQMLEAAQNLEAVGAALAKVEPSL